ncbi:hypothetical protein Tco_0909700 [Tanacetum coccineum]|uniref:Uncharacterized protein n=1 Tax=Tanacetum coccineum TaxID=301880 RepID=A0ABQ5CS08_9ASTR
MVANDEEIARKVQEEWEAEEEKKKLAEEEATKAAFTNERFLLTKNLGGYQKQASYKKTVEKPNDDILEVKKANEIFILIGSAKDEKLIEKMNEKAVGIDKEEVSKEPESTKVKAKIEELKENIRKSIRKRLKMKALKRSKRQKTDSDHEEENQLRTFLKIVPEEEEKIDYEVLGTRYPIINWESKFYDYGHFGRELIYYRVFRADGSSRWIKTFSEMIKFFDRMDLVEIHSLVMKRFETTPPEGIDLLLWGDLRIMFESKEDDELWKNQEEWKLQSWIFYENYGVHVLRLEDADSFLKYYMVIFATIVIGNEALDSPKQMAFELAIPEQTATGKGISNPLMAGSLPKTTKPTYKRSNMATLCAKIRTMGAVETVLCNRMRDGRQTRIKISVSWLRFQETPCQDREDFKKLKDFMTSQCGYRS